MPTNPYTPPPCTTPVFTDVPCSNYFSAWINQLYADQVSTGCPYPNFCPDQYVTRGQMSAFLERAIHGTTAWTPGDLGNQNTGIGASSLPFAASGSSNTAVGWSSLAADTSGQQNTAVGAWSLAAEATGSFNTAVGSQALSHNGNVSGNTAVGASSLNENTIGSQNVAVGMVAMEFNTTASRNTAVGSGALQAQSYDPGSLWSSYNTALGAYALGLNQPDGGNGGLNGTQNTAVGDTSLGNNTTGYFNTAVGVNSLRSVTSAPDDTAVGDNALGSDTTGFQNTAIGWKAGARGGDVVVGYVGSNVTFVNTTTGSYNTFIGISGATAQVDNCTAIGMDAYCDATNEVRLGNWYVTSIGGKVAWSALSDARAKTDIADLDLGLDLVMALRPVSYRLKGGNGRIDLGFVAQDVEAVLGDAYNVVDVGGDAQRTLSLRYTDLIAPLVKAVQEQQEKINALEAGLAEVESQRAEISALKAQVQALIAAQAAGAPTTSK